jgi:hypothetical protein
MPTLDDVARIAADLPGSEQKPSGGGMAWFVRRKPFAWELAPWPSLADEVRAIVAAETCLGVTVSGADDIRALAQMRPDEFLASESRWGGPKILIRLGAVPLDHLTELVIESWRLQAPQYLVRAFDTAE